MNFEETELLTNLSRLIFCGFLLFVSSCSEFSIDEKIENSTKANFDEYTVSKCAAQSLKGFNWVENPNFSEFPEDLTYQKLAVEPTRKILAVRFHQREMEPKNRFSCVHKISRRDEKPIKFSPIFNFVFAEPYVSESEYSAYQKIIRSCEKISPRKRIDAFFSPSQKSKVQAVSSHPSPEEFIGCENIANSQLAHFWLGDANQIRVSVIANKLFFNGVLVPK